MKDFWAPRNNTRVFFMLVARPLFLTISRCELGRVSLWTQAFGERQLAKTLFRGCQNSVDFMLIVHVFCRLGAHLRLWIVEDMANI